MMYGVVKRLVCVVLVMFLGGSIVQAVAIDTDNTMYREARSSWDRVAPQIKSMTDEWGVGYAGMLSMVRERIVSLYAARSDQKALRMIYIKHLIDQELVSVGSQNVEQLQSYDMHAVRYEMLRQINIARTKKGLNPLFLDDGLHGPAQNHATYMNTTEDYAHTTKDGSTFEQRIKAAVSYPLRAFGENIARGQTTVDQVMDSWMSSEGHKANILHESYTHIGIGLEGTVRVQTFGGKR